MEAKRNTPFWGSCGYESCGGVGRGLIVFFFPFGLKKLCTSGEFLSQPISQDDYAVSPLCHFSGLSAWQ